MLESLKISLPLVQRLFPIDVMFALADGEKFIYYLPGAKLDIRIQEGMAIPPSGGIRKALETGETVSADIPKEIYGLPFKSTSMPIRNGEGRLAVCLPLVSAKAYLKLKARAHRGLL